LLFETILILMKKYENNRFIRYDFGRNKRTATN
jgi:hypothetical protein